MRHTVLRRCAGTLLAAMAIAPTVSGQATGKRTPEQIKASYDAHQGEFDYLLGDWEFTSVSKQYGSTWRIRYYDIRPDRFSWTADQSTDGGKTWSVNHLQIEARRIGPARSLGPLAPAKNPAG